MPVDVRVAGETSNLSPMNRLSRIVLVALTAVLVLAVGVPALAGGGGHESETTTAEAALISAGDEPAVVLPPVEAEVVSHPWTTRYLIPFFVVTALALVVGVAVAYDRSIRRRYKVVS